MSKITAFAERLAENCPGVSTIWLIDEPHAPNTRLQHHPPRYSLVAFADPPSLLQLRGKETLHRTDVSLRVVTDGNRFEKAWGREPSSGSLTDWEWRRAKHDEAHYIDLQWTGEVGDRKRARIRRTAVLLWQSSLPRTPVKWGTQQIGRALGELASSLSISVPEAPGT